MDSQVFDYIDKNEGSFLERLKGLLRLESVSTKPEKKPELLKCAEMEAAILKEIGLENVELLPTTGNPIVYGEWLKAKGAPTILVYGHYDVQPADPLGQWQTPPFEPSVRDGNIYGRGTTDNKGQHFVYLCAIEAFLKTVKSLPVNVKIVLEGEEECGSHGIHRFVAEHPEKFACDCVMISDMPWPDFEHPAIVISLRGLIFGEIHVKGFKTDLHSGIFGGLFQNPVQALCSVLAKMKDDEGRVLVPGFYDDVAPLTKEEKEILNKGVFDAEAVRTETGAAELVTEKGFSPAESNSRRPTMDVCGIWGGFQEKGTKTIIPAEAGAKISFRLVPNQDPEKIMRQVTEFIQKSAPRGVTVDVRMSEGGKGALFDSRNSFIQKTVRAFEEAFGKEVVLHGEGASIPICSTFQSRLKVPQVLIGLGLPDDQLHAPNEKMSLNNFYRGIRAVALAFEAFGK